MACHDDFWHCRHADRIASEKAVHAVFGRCLVCGTCLGHIDPLAQGDSKVGGGTVGSLAKLATVDCRHVGEPWTHLVNVLSDQRVGHEADMVGDNHQVAHGEVGIDAAGGIADEEASDTQTAHDAYGECYLLHGVAFVVVEASLHGHDRGAVELSDDEVPLVAYGGTGLEVRYVAVRDNVGLLYAVAKFAEATAKNDGRRGPVFCAAADEFSRFVKKSGHF